MRRAASLAKISFIMMLARQMAQAVARRNLSRAVTIVITCIISVSYFSTISESSAKDPYIVSREAYAKKDAALEASDYLSDATLEYLNVGGRETFKGYEDIEATFDEFVGWIAPKRASDLNFRIKLSTRSGDIRTDHGVYGNRVGPNGDQWFGTLSTKVDLSQNSHSRFLSDVAGDATISEFESIEGSVLFDNEFELLDAEYLESLTGRYEISKSCELVVTRSAIRLFVRNTCTGEWRGLSRESGTIWTAGDTIISDKILQFYKFERMPTLDAHSLVVSSIHGEVLYSGDPSTSYTVERLRLPTKEGQFLGANVYIPKFGTNHTATVMVHGSGPQDRHGYASVIAVLADEFATNGHVVLTYDKRGIGQSDGEWSTTGFEGLADDAISAANFLRTLDEVNPRNVGMAGSSQAGWVIANVIARQGQPSHVFLLGAAGAALRVREQNLYNTAVRMRCAGLAEDDVALALEQQDRFFDFIKSGNKAGEFDRITERAKQRPGLAAWLFPSSSEVQLEKASWFTVLDLEFDPIPIWSEYKGKLMFVFAEYDDSTPTDMAVHRLSGHLPTLEGRIAKRVVSVLEGAQHIGLATDNRCNSNLSTRHRFVLELFDLIDEFTQ